MPAPPTRLMVPSPCTQPWQTMPPDQQGRFCGHCQKTIIDFTAMTDAQVLAHLRAAGDSGCGRFRTDQMNRALVKPVASRPGQWRWVSLLLPLWLSAQVVQGQTANTAGRSAGGTFLPVLKFPTDRVDTTAQGLMPDGTMVLKGRIIDLVNQQPVGRATVVIRHTTYIAITDPAGAFSLTTPAMHPDSTVQLVAGAIGYGNRELPVTIYMAGQPLRIELREDAEALNTVVRTGKYVVEKPTFRRRIRNWFKRN